MNRISFANFDPGSWPACSLESDSGRPEAAWIVVFGASGDLSRRKIFPALYDLHADGILPPETRMLGFARRPSGDAAFRAEIRAACEAFARRAPASGAGWDGFADRITYLQADLESPEGYGRLAEILGGGGPPNALFYLAVGPELFAPIARALGAAGLGSRGGPGDGARGTVGAHGADGPHGPGGADSPGGATGAGVRGWRRLVVEKPYGKNRDGARALSLALQTVFDEGDIFRIDHYLGKETVQNLLYLRFSNAIFEPLWNRTHIESVDISVFETVGVGSRGGYYDGAGAARDMIQNHLVQLFCLTAMEPPAGLSPENIRDEKVKVLRSVPDWNAAQLRERSLRAQYAAGTGADGAPVPAYRDTEKVRPDSTTETYAALRLELDNWRFSGVPFILRTGKALDRRSSEISIRFRRPPAALFAARCGDTLAPNVLTIRIQPDEGVYMTFNAKVPGSASVRPNQLRFSFREKEGYFPEAYERLIADALSGDSTLFIRADESEESWRIIDALEAAWADADPESPRHAGGLLRYAAGSPPPDFPVGGPE